MQVRVKICGLTNLEDAQAAVNFSADMLGFIFVPASPRYVTPEEVRDILCALKFDATRPVCVGVFANDTVERIESILGSCGLDLAQLHGNEDPEMLRRLSGRSYKALRPRNAEEAQVDAVRYAGSEYTSSTQKKPAFLIDTYHPITLGGTGKTGDWQLAAGLAQHYPLLLAGGLTPSNVRQAIQAIHPWGLDVSSGIESVPGHKNLQAMQDFISIVKSIY